MLRSLDFRGDITIGKSSQSGIAMCGRCGGWACDPRAEDILGRLWTIDLLTRVACEAREDAAAGVRAVCSMASGTRSAKAYVQ